MFEAKINDIVSESTISPTVDNGTTKINEDDKNFMTPVNIREAILNLKLKNSEGFVRIPQWILIDGISKLIPIPPKYVKS